MSLTDEPKWWRQARLDVLSSVEFQGRSKDAGFTHWQAWAALLLPP
jgi:hypothetical protein